MRHHLVAWVCLGTLLGMLAGCGGGADSGGRGASSTGTVEAALKEPEPEIRASKLIEIGAKQGKGKNLRQAEETLDLAYSACEQIKDPATRAQRFTLLAQKKVDLENRSGAKRCLRAAREAADAIEDTESKGKALGAIARVQGAAKDTEGAVDTLKATEKIADGVKDTIGKISILGPVALAYGKMGQEAEVDRVLQAAVAAAEGAGDAQARTNALADVAAIQSQLKKPKAEVEKTFNQAVESARKIEQPFGQSQTMIELALKLSKAGFAARAHEVLKESEKVAEKISEVDLHQQTVEKIRATMDEVPKP